MRCHARSDLSQALENMAQAAVKKIDVRPARTPSERRRFVDLPYKLYRGDPHWIAPLRMAQKDILNTKSHPFYKTSDVEMFLAYRGDKVVGRIMAILNNAHNEFHNERAGFFGFFEVENDNNTKCVQRSAFSVHRSSFIVYRCSQDIGNTYGSGHR
jgi:hypothetical protein